MRLAPLDWEYNGDRQFSDLHSDRGSPVGSLDLETHKRAVLSFRFLKEPTSARYPASLAKAWLDTGRRCLRSLTPVGSRQRVVCIII